MRAPVLNRACVVGWMRGFGEKSEGRAYDGGMSRSGDGEATIEKVRDR